MTLSTLLPRSPRRPARPRTRAAGPRAVDVPELVQWTNEYRVTNGRADARFALLLFPGETEPRRTPVALDVVVLAAA